MSFKRTKRDVSLNGAAGAAVTVGASQTNSVVSLPFGIPGRGDTPILIAVKVSAATKTTGITLQLQTSSMNDDATPPAPLWTTATGISTTVSGAISSVTVLEIRGGTWNSGQAAAYPLGMQGRLVCTTGTGDSITIEAVWCYTDNH